MTAVPAAAREVGFRPASPADVDAAVPLIYSSGPASFDYVFAPRRSGGAQAFLRQAFLQNSGEFSHRTHTVGLVGGQVVAIGASFDGRATLQFTIAAARQILGHYGPLQSLQTIARGLRAESVIRPPRPRELYLCHLGVAPALRGAGIGTRLIEHLLERRDGALHDSVVLDVAVTNPRAEALYRRVGFTVAAIRRSSLANRHGTVADHRRMTLPAERRLRRAGPCGRFGTG